MLSCRKITELASDWLDGELPVGQRLQIRMHLLMCRHCRSFVDGLAATVNTLREASLTVHEPAPAFYYRVDKVLEQRLATEQLSRHNPSEMPNVQQPASNEPLIQGITDPDDERVERIFADIEATTGFIPNLFRAYAHNPEVLEQNWAREKALMYGGHLNERLKSAIAVVVSRDNGCHYCLHHHTVALSELGMSPEEILQLQQEPLAANFPAGELALLTLARQANRDPHGASRDQVDWARRTGASDSDIVEALAVMELYSSFNRFLETLRIPLENQASGL